MFLNQKLLAATLMTTVVGVAVSTPAQAQLDVTQNSNGIQLLNSLLGNIDGLSNFAVNLFGNPNAFGTFDGGTFGIESGVVLSTGSVVDLEGPNDRDNTESIFQTPGLPGEPNTNDGAILQITFDADVTAQQIGFDYIFGSEEFPEFAGTEYNDLFKLTLNGVNLAKLTNGDDVTINNLTPSGDPASWSPDYINNVGGITTNDTELDGYTKALGFLGDLKLGTNILEIQIADTNDWSFDSAVFLKGGSITSDPTDPVAVPEPALMLGLGAVAAGLLVQKYSRKETT
ncbi:MAG: PEP-CTERM sorting domain-containing protein [Leptolyngbya sp. SIOISBB]|nr:PEP-CTERM sorting domain-containing protein [Leptolyngbya sp. SIOISBB]